MADPISIAAKFVADLVGAAFINAAAYPLIYATAYYGTYGALAVGVTAGLGAIARAQIPDPEGAKITRKQPRPPRQYVIGGESRFSGAYMLRETNENNLAVVLALAEGRLHDISRVYLNDDVATIGGDGWVVEGDDKRYGFQRVKIDTRLGIPSETHYSQLTAKFGSVWPTSARGDGIASLMMLANHGSMEYYNRDFPNGEPIPSVVGQGVCYDWRDEGQDKADPSTWGPSSNPIVWLVHLEWFLWGRSWTRSIEPYLDALTVEAGICDESVAKVGGTEPRYRFAGNFFSNTEPDAVRTAILASCDGWLSTNGKGGLVIKAGRYEEPTFTITADHIEGYTWRAFQTDEEACNELVISYVSPEHHYTEVEADPLRDEAGITATGRIRSENLQLLWVNHFTQARRLAKRKMSRLAAPRRGQIRTGIYGLNGLGHRYIRVQNPELASMADVVVEVMNVECDFAAGQVTFDVILADQNIDEWNPATEEGSGAVYTPPVPREQLDPPTIEDVEVFYDGANLPRLRVTAAGPDRGDILWRVGYRETGAPGFNEESLADLDPLTPVLLETGIVPQGDLEVIVGYQTGNGTLSWMDAGDAVAIRTLPGPNAPTEFAAEVVGTTVEITWRNPGTASLDHLIVYRGATAVFGDAIDVSSELVPTGLLAAQTFTDTAPLIGDAYYWVVAYTDANDASTPAGPDSVTYGEAEAVVLLAEFTTPATEARAVLINDLVAALKTGGVWTKLDGLYVLAAETSQAALLNWITPAGTAATTAGGPTFTADRGYTGTGGSYLSLGYGPGALVKGNTNSLSIGTWDQGAGGSGYSIGLSGNFASALRIDNGNGAIAGGLVNDSLALTFATATAEGLTALNRSASNARQVYRDGASQGSDAQASSGAFSASTFFLLRDISTGGGFSTRRISAAFIGGSLTGPEHAALYAALNDYLTAIGAA